jgi:hypothetical protein
VPPELLHHQGVEAEALTVAAGPHLEDLRLLHELIAIVDAAFKLLTPKVDEGSDLFDIFYICCELLLFLKMALLEA